MFDWLPWFDKPDSGKIALLILLFTIFCAILIYLFTSKKRAKRLESYKYIPFQDDDPDEINSESPKVMENERDK